MLCSFQLIPEFLFLCKQHAPVQQHSHEQINHYPAKVGIHKCAPLSIGAESDRAFALPMNNSKKNVNARMVITVVSGRFYPTNLQLLSMILSLVS